MDLIRLLALSVFLSIFSSLCYGQSRVFTKKAPPGQIVSRLGYAYDPVFAFGDIDSDGDEDMIVTGSNRVLLPDFYSDLNSIYVNDGSGAFQSKSSNCFPESRDVPTFLHDVDGDNDLDFIVTGILQGPSIAIYLNNGSGGFSESDSVTFPTYTDYDVALGDINNDGIMDIVVSSIVFKIHLGDGNGGFGDTVISQVDGLTDCALLIDDLNNDGISDIIATGKSNGSHAFRYYQGQGNLSFNQVTTNIPGLSEDPSLALGDVNNDGYLDIGIMGENANGDPVTSLYINTGGSAFTKEAIPDLLQLQEGDIHLVDFSGDSNLDIFATGVVGFGNGDVCALKNTTSGWTLINTSDFVNLQEEGCSEVHDVNGDNLPEVFLGGSMRDISYKTSYIVCEYLNKGNSEFYRTDGSHFWNEEIGYKVVGDFTGDGFPDIIAGGLSTPNLNRWLNAYQNDGTGNFDTVSTNLPLYRISGVSSINADGDNYEDIICFYDWGYEEGPSIFLSSGTGINFARDSVYIDYAYEGGLSVGDIDGDGDDDFTYMAEAFYNGPYELRVMLNDGTGKFSELSLSSPPILADVSKPMFADFNNDSYTDLFFPKVKQLYHWDPSTSEYVADTAFPTGSVAYYRNVPYTSIADFDNNGRFDIMTGYEFAQNGQGLTTFDLILQDTNGVFTYDFTFSFPPSEMATIDTADFDQDGDIDVVYVGTDRPHHDFLAMILENDGQGNFSEYPYHELTRMSRFSWFMDVDNDGDHDIMQVGTDHNKTIYIGQVHENHVCLPVQKDTTVSTCASSFTWGITGCEYTASGQYSRRFVNAQNCYELYELNLEIKGFETQVHKIDTGLICTIDTFASYQWYDCSNGAYTAIAGATSFEFYPANNGSYALVAINAAGCADTSECTTINTISVEELTSNNLEVNIYPNPTDAYIQIDGLPMGGSVELFDLRGRKMLSKTLKFNERNIDISNFKNGVYLLKLNSNGKGAIIKVLKI